MKKLIYIILLAIFILPFGVFAKDYTIKDLTVSVDDSFYVFTRDNIKDNPTLDDLGITYDYMNNFMTTSNVYLDSIKIDEEDSTNVLEWFVVIKKVNNVNNLHTYKDSKITELGEAFKKTVGADSYKMVSVDKYKYYHVKYYDSTNSYNIDQYYTVMNGYGYTIMAQKTANFTSDEAAMIEKIVKSSKYEYNAKYEKSSSGNSFWTRILVAAITGGILGGIGSLAKKKNAKKEKPTTPPIQASVENNSQSETNK